MKSIFKKEYILKIYCIAMVLFMISVIFCGCATPNRIYTLNEALSHEALTLDNIKNIAALRYGSVNQIEFIEGEEPILTPVNYELTPVQEGLSDSIKKKIIRDFKPRIKVDGHNITECHITDYYGTYNGYIVVEIHYAYKNLSVPTVSLKLIVSDFYLGDINHHEEIIAWRI